MTRRVRAALPWAKAGAGMAAAAARPNRLRRCMALDSPDAPENGESLHPVRQVPPKRGEGVVGPGRDIGQPLHRLHLDLPRQDLLALDSLGFRCPMATLCEGLGLE